MQESVWTSALAIAAVEVVAAIGVCIASPGQAGPGAALGAAQVVFALAVASLARRRARHLVVALAWTIGLLPVFSAVTTGLLAPQLTPYTAAALAMVPVAFAAFVPLDRRAHLLWLGLALAVCVGSELGLGGVETLQSPLPRLASALLASSALSLLVNRSQLRQRRQVRRHVLAVRTLTRQIREHARDARRQDEFLRMQQETLVVQQAELLRLAEELESAARVDALTGLGSTLRLTEDFAQTAARIDRNGGTAGLLLLDLDRFDRLNRAVGHLAGDAVLRRIAEALRRTSRTGDGLYRYGGEEFLVLLHDCDGVALEAAAQRFTRAVEALAIPHRDNPPFDVVTVSAAAVSVTRRNCRDLDELFRAAGEALERAKARGGNAVEVYVNREPIQLLGREERAAG